MPSHSEWTTLTTYLGDDFTSNKFDVASNKLKEKGTTHWKENNNESTNETGFKALPGGYSRNGNFTGISTFGCWWSATEYDATSAWYINMGCYTLVVGSFDNIKKDGISVRCLKD